MRRMRMEGNARRWFTPRQKAELWERWRNGQCIADIARAVARRNKSGVYRVLALNGGITQAARQRARDARGSSDTQDRGEARTRTLRGKSGTQAARRSQRVSRHRG